MTKSAPTFQYPGYDVLRKRSTPSWDDATRSVIDERLATPADPRYFDAVQWLAVSALCPCIVPQRPDRPPVPLPALLDTKLLKNEGDGYRDARLPPLRDAWRIGLAALDDESRQRHELPLASIPAPARTALLDDAWHGTLRGPAWQEMPCDVFFMQRVLHDICALYYSHPHAWSEIGFGGPANPRGYVRMYFDRRDPWEAVQAKAGEESRAFEENQRAR